MNVSRPARPISSHCAADSGSEPTIIEYIGSTSRRRPGRPVV